MSTQQLETRIVELNAIDDLLSYRDEWNRLLSRTPDASFFQTLEWLSVYWKYFGAAKHLRVLMVLEGERLVGALPLVSRPRANRLASMSTLSYPLDHWGTRCGPVGPSPHRVLAAGLAWLAKDPAIADVIELYWVSGRQREAVERAFAEARLPIQIARTAPASEIDLTAGWESYWSSRSSKHRNNVRRAERKLSRTGEITVLHHFGQPDPRWNLYEMCEDVASRSWQGTSTTGNTLTHTHVRDFLREVHQVASDQRAVSMHVVAVDDQPVAFAYNYLFGDTLFALRMGYCSDFADAGPGSFLIEQVIREAARQGYRTIDLGEGDASYKHSWRTHEVATFRVSHYRRFSLFAQAKRLKRHWSRAFRIS